MAASANPSGGHSSNNNNSNNNNNNNNNNDDDGNTNESCSGGRNENVSGAAANSNSGGISVAETSSAVGTNQTALRHNPGLSLDWTPEEQSTLEELLLQYTSETKIVRYAKIAQALNDKTVRDVALRCRWMHKKESGKRRKDDPNSSKKIKDKKEKVTDSLPKSSQVANRSSGPPYGSSMMSMDNDDGIPYKMIGGASGQLLEQNAQALEQISANFAAYKLHENINLFRQARNNILSILDDDMPEIMKQMPPLPVKLNEDLVNSILP